VTIMSFVHGHILSSAVVMLTTCNPRTSREAPLVLKDGVIVARNGRIV